MANGDPQGQREKSGDPESQADLSGRQVGRLGEVEDTCGQIEAAAD
jgi:hypothetical protein